MCICVAKYAPELKPLTVIASYTSYDDNLIVSLIILSNNDNKNNNINILNILLLLLVFVISNTNSITTQ